MAVRGPHGEGPANRAKTGVSGEIPEYSEAGVARGGSRALLGLWGALVQRQAQAGGRGAAGGESRWTGAESGEGRAGPSGPASPWGMN